MEADKNLYRILLRKLRRQAYKWYITFFIFLSFFCIGIYGLIQQIDKGHIVTGMRDNVVWGFYIVNFIFFMGLSYSGALISGVLHLFHTGWRKPVDTNGRINNSYFTYNRAIFYFLLYRHVSTGYYFLFTTPPDPVADHLGRNCNMYRPCRMLYLSLSFIH